MAWDKLFGREGSGRKAAGARSDNPAAPASEPNAPEANREHRRSKRVFISIRVLIKCHSGAQPYQEETLTEAVNAHGCLLRLNITPERGQTLTVVNTKSSREAQCRVAYVSRGEGGKTKVGVEFLEPAERFWHIAFPPDDWNAADFSDAVVQRAGVQQSQKRA